MACSSDYKSLLPPCCNRQITAMDVIQNTHVGFCRAEGKVKGQRRVNKLWICIHFPTSAHSPWSTHTRSCTHIHAVAWCWCMCIIIGRLDISGENLAFSSWWRKPNPDLIYPEYTVYNTHTHTHTHRACVYMNRQMGRRCAWCCAFLRFHHVAFLLTSAST